MDKFIAQLSTWEWWVGVVVVGVVINVVSHFLLNSKPLSRWHSWSKKRAAQETSWIAAFQQSEKYRTYFVYQAIRMYALAILTVLVTLASLAIAFVALLFDPSSKPVQIVALLIGAVSFINSLNFWWSAMRRDDVIRRAVFDEAH